jgi:hypothetical protein
MPRVTLSYRRDDSAGIARLIFERLKPRYGGDSVFMDIDAIEFGEDYRDKIHQALGQTDFLLVLIGPRWLGPTPGGRNRINDTTDPVRMEVERALEIGLRVVPILLENTPMPSPGELPETLGRLPYLNAAEVTAGREFDGQIDRIIRFIDRTFAAIEARRAREAKAGEKDLRVTAPPTPDVPLPADVAPPAATVVPLRDPPDAPAPPTPVVAAPAPPTPVVAVRRSNKGLVVGMVVVLGLGGFIALVNADIHAGSKTVSVATEAPTAAPTTVPTLEATSVPTAAATLNIFAMPVVPPRVGATVPVGFSVMYPRLGGLFWKPTRCSQTGSSARVSIQLFNDYRGTLNTDVALTKPEKSFVTNDWVQERQHLAPGLSPTYSRTFASFKCGSKVSSGVRRVRFGEDSGPYVSFS